MRATRLSEAGELSEEAEAKVDSALNGRRDALLERLFTLFGVGPLAAFVVVYLWSAARAMAGVDAYAEAVGGSGGHPYWLAVEVGVFWLPLAFHAAFGARVVLRGRPHPAPYAEGAAWRGVLQRVSGGVLLLFLGYHGWRFRLSSEAPRNAVDTFQAFCAELSMTVGGVPLMAMLYLLGLAALVFHLAQGLATAFRAWGWEAIEALSLRWSVVWGVFGALLYVLASSTVIYFATGLSLAPAALGEGSPAAGCQVSDAVPSVEVPPSAGSMPAAAGSGAVRRIVGDGSGGAADAPETSGASGSAH